MPFTTQYGPGSFKPYWSGNILMRPDPRRANQNIMGRPPTPPAMQQPQNAGGIVQPTPNMMGNQAAQNALALPNDPAESNQMNPFAQPSQYVGDMSPEDLSMHYRNNERLARNAPDLGSLNGLFQAAIAPGATAAHVGGGAAAGWVNSGVLGPQADLLGVNPLTGRPDYDPNQDTMLGPPPGVGSGQPAPTPMPTPGSTPFNTAPTPPSTQPGPAMDENQVTPFGQDGFLGGGGLVFPEYQPAYTPPGFAPFDIMGEGAPGTYQSTPAYTVPGFDFSVEPPSIDAMPANALPSDFGLSAPIMAPVEPVYVDSLGWSPNDYSDFGASAPVMAPVDPVQWDGQVGTVDYNAAVPGWSWDDYDWSDPGAVYGGLY